MHCDLHTPIPEWILEYPVTASVFDELGLDTSCGGKSLEYVAMSNGQDPLDVLHQLERTVHAAAADPPAS